MPQGVVVPAVTTERLRLRPWRDVDLDVLTAINADVRVAEWLGGVNTREQTRARMDAWEGHWARFGFGMWAVETLEDGGLIGRVGFTHHEDWTASPHDAEIGWALAHDAWGRGYATEAARAALDWASERDELQTIISVTRRDNVRSQRVMEKLGLTYRGKTNWRGFDQVWYALDADSTQAPR